MTQSAMYASTKEGAAEGGASEATRAFARALTESTEFQAFEQAAERMRHDEAAQRALRAFETKQQSLQMMLMLNAVSPEDQAELERLRRAFVEEPSVAAYLQAQEVVMAMCQAAADVLSKRIGLSFASACGPGCC